MGTDNRNVIDPSVDRSKEGIIKAWFDYDPETEEITWKKWVSPDWYKHKPYHKKFLETRAGMPVKFSQKASGHLITRIAVASKSDIFAHQIVWVLSYGEMPQYQIDHIDGDPSNNSLANLRDVPHNINMRNTKMRSDNTSGYTGVGFREESGKWFCHVGKASSQTHIGSFDTLEQAVKAREDYLSSNAHLGYTERHGR